MYYWKTILTVAALAVGAGMAAGESVRRDGSDTLRIDFGAVETPTEPAYRAEVDPAAPAPVKEFRIPVTHETIRIAAGVEYEGWTFGGTVPGPTLRVREGDLVRIHLVNESPMPHSIDLHSARIPMNEAFRTIGPGEEHLFEFIARDPGAYLVHCGTPPVLMHVMQGMYMAIIVDPAGGWGTEVDEEFVIVQSEFYGHESDDDPALEADYEAAMEREPTRVVFNGRAFQYKENPLEVDVGDRVRLFVVNAGPNLESHFHIVGAVFDRVIPDGDPEHALTGIQTWQVPVGGGAVFETTFEAGRSGEGVYAFLTHALADAELGAVGLIHVGEPELLAGAGH